MSTDFNTWTASRTGEVRHYFNGRIAGLVGITFDQFGTLDQVNGKDATLDLNRNDRSRLVDSLRSVKVWVDADGIAHVTGWDARLAVVTARDIAAAVESAYAAENAPAEEAGETAAAPVARTLVTEAADATALNGFTLTEVEDGFRVTDGAGAEYVTEDAADALRTYADFIDTFIEDADEATAREWQAAIDEALTDAAALA